jgi:hypothetical protein
MEARGVVISIVCWVTSLVPTESARVITRIPLAPGSRAGASYESYAPGQDLGMATLLGRIIRMARGPQGRKVLAQAQKAARSPQGRKLFANAEAAARDPKNRARLRAFLHARITRRR